MKVLVSLFSPQSGGTLGGLTRSIAIANELERQGESVVFSASGEIANSLEKKGYTYYPLPESTAFGLPGPISNFIINKAKNMSVKKERLFGSIYFAMAFVNLDNSSYFRKLVDAQLQIIKNCKPDIIFTELDCSAYIASIISGVPLAATYASVFEHGIDSFFYRKVEKSMNSILKSYGLPPRKLKNLFQNKDNLKIIPSIPELEDVELSDEVFFTGSLLGDIIEPKSESFIPELGKRYVFIYTGSMSLSISFLKENLPKIFGKHEELVCMVASQLIDKPYRIGNIEYRPFVLDTKILPYCDWVICHGGHNTIIRALSYGVPLIIFPCGHFERSQNAQKVAKQNVGVKGSISDFNPEWFESVLQREDILKKNAEKMGNILKNYPGPSGTVEKMKEWLKTKSYKY